MSTAYHNNLSKLRPILPANYQVKLHERLNGIELWQIKKAFIGTLQDVEILGRILAEAIKMAEEHSGINDEAASKIDQLLVAAKRKSRKKI